MIKLFRSRCFSAIFLLFVLCVSCHKKDVPTYVIPEQKMSEILQDAYLLEGFYAIETQFHYDTLGAEMMASVDSLFAKHEISQHDFDTSIAWYIHHPDIYKRVHDSVIARLDREMSSGIISSPDPPQPAESSSEPEVGSNEICF